MLENSIKILHFCRMILIVNLVNCMLELVTAVCFKAKLNSSSYNIY